MAWRLTRPRGQVRHIYRLPGETGQTGLTDRSDRSHPRNDLHSEIQTKTPVGAKPEKGTRFHSTAEFLSSTRSLLRDAATSMKIRFAVFEGSAKTG